MKSIAIKILVIVMLVLSSISICLANDNGCDDRSGSSPVKIEKTQKHDDTKKEESETHHCLCSMSCNSLYVEYLTYNTKISTTILSKESFSFIPATYPQVLLNLDKPPII